MSYAIFTKASRKQNEDKGESWVGESIAERVNLCECQTITPLFLKHLPKKGRILEAGCGLGRWLIYLTQKGYSIEGLELNQDAVKRVLEFDNTLKVRTGDIQSMPYENNSFDAVMSLGVIEHFIDGPGRVLGEVHRILKPGGVIFVSVPYINLIRRCFHIPYQALVVKIRRMQGYNMKFASYVYTVKEMNTFMKEAGFKTVRTAWDDFIYPKSLGLYTDWMRFVGKRNLKWELNRFGKVIHKVLSLLPERISANGVLYIATKEK